MHRQVGVGKLSTSTSALFVCDVQEKFRALIYQYPSVIEMTSYLLQGAKSLDLPVVVTEQVPDKLGSTVAELEPHISPGTPRFPKKKFSMLTPEVETHLVQNLPNVNQVLLCGIEAHVCVTQTALDLLAKGYEVHLIVDAVSSSRVGDRHIALQRLQQAGAHMASAEMAMFQLCETAASPNFKAVSNLAKLERKCPQLTLFPSML